MEPASTKLKKLKEKVWENISFLLVLALVLITVVLILLIKGQRYNIKSENVIADDDHQGVPLKLKNYWHWITDQDSKTNNCNFENYIFGHSIDQADPCLIKTFKNKMLLPPPPNNDQPLGKLNISGELASNIEKFWWIEKLLINNPENNNPKGFFIECGANDGEFISPTIRLEKQYNWTGLLIEANPIPFQSLLEKKRNAWTVNAAVCTSKHPEPVTIYTNPENTGLSGMNARVEYGVYVGVTVQCIPLYTMLAALNVKVVDYLSLDVEGFELAILKTVAFDLKKFMEITVKYGLIPGQQYALKEFLEPKGYRFVKEIRDESTTDCLFVHESLYKLANSTKYVMLNSYLFKLEKLLGRLI